MEIPEGQKGSAVSELLNGKPAELQETFRRFLAFMRKPDTLVVSVLNGHLLIEEMLTRIITKFVLHGEFIKEAKLTFAQKISVAQSLSWDEQRNPMWQLLVLINALRNEYSHELEPERAAARIENLRAKHNEVLDEAKLAEDASKEEILQAVVVAAMGFLAAFEREVELIRQWVGRMDPVVQAHRYYRARVAGKSDQEPG